eukprot:CAMPEP_0172162556 /NCGR_PEP_ID=MMETSP1050-20130122/6742_1 /TAXON_ID=233186 /ORGANISM="Cryptomonas curvata, Strain CCAP979/52" /LENGTH=452 /DNA_ID=CAMNT_0012832569 /DNA_START=696 /DNA_END=2054 /DNA_ORIENTATION=+
MHLFACGFWRLKYEVDQDSLREFLDYRGLSGQDAGQNYMLCLYFVCTVFTTVGFGDIYAQNSAERVFCITLMIMAACLFATILGEVQSIYTSVYKKNQDIEDQLQSITNFLSINKVPTMLQRRVRSWLRMRFLQDRAINNMRSITDLLPRDMFGQIAIIMNGLMFSKVPLFRLVRDEGDRALLAAALIPFTKTASFLSQAIIAHHADPADRLVIISSGRVAVCVKRDDGGAEASSDRLCVLQEGDGFGDTSVLGDTRWGGAYGVEATFIAMDTVTVSYIYTKDIVDILDKDPALYSVKRIFARQKRNWLANAKFVSETWRKGIFHWILLSKKLLRKREETRKHSLTELFPDRALAAVKRVQSREKAPINTWVRSTRSFDVEADQSIFSSSGAELCFLKGDSENIQTAKLISQRTESMESARPMPPALQNDSFEAPKCLLALCHQNVVEPGQQ